MSTCPGYSYLLVLPHLHVQNANAVSSPLTHGFPSITAFLGLMWALERKARDAGLDLALNAVGVVCHDHQELVTEGGYVKAFRLTRNPLGPSYWGALVIGEIVAVIQAVVGVIRLGGGGPFSPIHVLYGTLSVVIWPAAFGYMRGQQDSRTESLVYGLVSLFLFGIAIRALTTGP